MGSPVSSTPNESSPLPEYPCLCTRTLVAGHMTRSLPLQGLLHRHLVLLSATNRMKHISGQPCLNSGSHPSEAWYHNVNRCARPVVWDPPSSFPCSDAVLAGCHLPGESSCVNLLFFSASDIICNLVEQPSLHQPTGTGQLLGPPVQIKAQFLASWVSNHPFPCPASRSPNSKQTRVHPPHVPTLWRHGQAVNVHPH